MLKIGSKDMKTMYIGDRKIKKAYLGSTLVYEEVITEKLPCWINEIYYTDEDTASSYFDITKTKVFYLPDGRTAIGLVSNKSAVTSSSTNVSVNIDATFNIRGSSFVKPEKGNLFLIIIDNPTEVYNIEIEVTGSSLNGVTEIFLWKYGNSKGTPTKYITNQYVKELTFSNAYATEEYFTEANCGVGYAEDGNMLILMRNGSTTAYENLKFDHSSTSLLSGVTLDNQTNYSGDTTAPNASSNAYGGYYGAVLSGLSQNCNIDITMGTRDSSSDYVKCSINMIAV